MTIEGRLDAAPCVVAIVGTREPAPAAAEFAHQLAAALARAGAVVVSGGAVGIDVAAHRGALSASGRTWAVAATGRGQSFPAEHEELYRQIADGPGAMIWPFSAGVAPLRQNFPRRNGVIVALSDVLVVVQAGAPSGSLNAVSWAKRLGRPVWAVPGPPWDPLFTGCRACIDGGARVLTSITGFLQALAVSGAPQLSLPLEEIVASPAPPVQDDAGQALWLACTHRPRHIDEIAIDARLCTSTAATRLLTLALENVLVEGPDGFYRRAK